MPTGIRYFLWAIVSLGMMAIAVMAFWVFLIILGVFIVARIIYAKIFNKGSRGSFTIHTYTVRPGPRNHDTYGPGKNIDPNQEITTIIDADNLDQEYKIPKIK